MRGEHEKRYSVRLQFCRAGENKGTLYDVSEVVVAADGIDEAKREAVAIMGEDVDGRKVRVASIIEFAAAVR